ncbi:thiamine transporter SLC35F3 [Nephila pilipes]|uniref:Thiamine transporter SLC35F3 n=1 Tax=Nephila pilipes TaxID=299642 RepID=A0A8X6KBR4_NEPPI|nr:thiamine transporter SLC35F3 [Nephila pilipes]
MSESIELCNLAHTHFIEDALPSIETLVSSNSDQDIVYVYSLLGQNHQQQLENVDTLIAVIDEQIKPHIDLLSQKEQHRTNFKTRNDIHSNGDGDNNDIHAVDPNIYINALESCKMWIGKKDKILEVRQRIQVLSEDPVRWNHVSLNHGK